MYIFFPTSLNSFKKINITYFLIFNFHEYIYIERDKVKQKL